MDPWLVVNLKISDYDPLVLNRTSVSPPPRLREHGREGWKTGKTWDGKVAVKPLSLIGMGRLLWSLSLWLGWEGAVECCFLGGDGKGCCQTLSSELRWEGCVKCCLLDTAWLLESWAHSSSGYLHKTCVLLAHPFSVMGEGRGLHLLTLSQGIHLGREGMQTALIKCNGPHRKKKDMILIPREEEGKRIKDNGGWSENSIYGYKIMK